MDARLADSLTLAVPFRLFGTMKLSEQLCSRQCFSEVTCQEP